MCVCVCVVPVLVLFSWSTKVFLFLSLLLLLLLLSTLKRVRGFRNQNMSVSPCGHAAPSTHHYESVTNWLTVQPCLSVCLSVRGLLWASTHQRCAPSLPACLPGWLERAHTHTHTHTRLTKPKLTLRILRNMKTFLSFTPTKHTQEDFSKGVQKIHCLPVINFSHVNFFFTITPLDLHKIGLRERESSMRVRLGKSRWSRPLLPWVWKN